MSPKALRWIERLVWLFIYGGLLAASLGLFVLQGGDALLGWLLIGKGSVVALAGVVLMLIRSRWP